MAEVFGRDGNKGDTCDKGDTEREIKEGASKVMLAVHSQPQAPPERTRTPRHQARITPYAHAHTRACSAQSTQAHRHPQRALWRHHRSAAVAAGQPAHALPFRHPAA